MLDFAASECGRNKWYLHSYKASYVYKAFYDIVQHVKPVSHNRQILVSNEINVWMCLSNCTIIHTVEI